MKKVREVIARKLYAKHEELYDPEGCGMLDVAIVDAYDILDALKEAGYVVVKERDALTASQKGEE